VREYREARMLSEKGWVCEGLEGLAGGLQDLWRVCFRDFCGKFQVPLAQRHGLEGVEDARSVEEVVSGLQQMGRDFKARVDEDTELLE
jgi:hypothetical protein